VIADWPAATSVKLTVLGNWTVASEETIVIGPAARAVDPFVNDETPTRRSKATRKGVGFGRRRRDRPTVVDTVFKQAA
jgi:hypothetical protein